MIRNLGVLSLAGAALVLLQAPAHAQVNTQWGTSRRLPPSRVSVRRQQRQVLFRTGDLNKDVGPIVAVRKQQASQTGKFPAFLLMNEHGVLQDRTPSVCVGL